MCFGNHCYKVWRTHRGLKDPAADPTADPTAASFSSAAATEPPNRSAAAASLGVSLVDAWVDACADAGKKIKSAKLIDSDPGSHLLRAHPEPIT